MKYMLLFIGSDERWEGMPEKERQEHYRRIGEWWGEHSQAGRIVGGEELQAARTATTVRFQNGKPVVTDGPFVEAKERIGGFALVDVPDLDAALELAKTWPAQGAVEVRPVVHEH
ncbi:MAG TPA: YciI family protein [Candidatus Acidoferrales bacterium]|nr:YciI family protein [Candidatus Acidoferrales bacterium]